MEALSVLVLQLLMVPVLSGPSGDYWDSWGPYGDCSRSCGSGVTVRSRRCITQRTDGGHSCVGPEKSYSSCNIQDCLEGSRDFREVQCSNFDAVSFQGKLYKWLPYYGAENPCELNCMPKGENFFYRHRQAVVDGTPCHPGRKDVCVGGVCKRLGCDNIMDSPQQEDPCLQCGGSGQSCYSVKSTFTTNNLPHGYNQMFIIPVGATTISIRETVATRNYLAIKNLRGEYYLNGHWLIDFSMAKPIAGTVLYYQRGAEGDNVPETIIGRGPTTEPLIVEIISEEANQGVDYEYFLSHAHSRDGYYWSFGSWSTCSRECSSGYQSRLVFCTFDNESYPDYLCASLPRPQTNRTCNPQACPQTRSWSAGEWNTCSVSCGGGSQVRRVECVSHDASGPRVVADAVCAAYAEAPPSMQTCNMHRCAEYQVTGWSGCSVTCGTGEQTREVTCVDARGQKREETFCSSLLHPHAIQTCQMAACPPQTSWHASEWRLCSRSCGSGSRDRQVTCLDRDGNLYPEEQCPAHIRPPTVERCNSQPCHRAAARHPDAGAQTNTARDPYRSGPVIHCSQSLYGCCPDGRTAAGGLQSLGCPQGPAPAQHSCAHTSYGCCQDGMTASLGANWEGCAEFVPPAVTTAASSLPLENAMQCRATTYGCCYDRATPAGGPNGEGCPDPPHHIARSTCSLPRAAGSCSEWTLRFYYNILTSQCTHFWYGSCHGNSNNFLSHEECQRACPVPAPVPDPASGSGPAFTTPTIGGSGMGRSSSVGSVGAGSRSMGRIFTVHRSSASGAGRQATSAATHAQRGRLHMRHRRPSHTAAAQHSRPAASLSLSVVTIDKSDPDTVEALVGQTVVLPCSVSPPPSSTIVVEWRRDGVPVSSHRHHQQPNGSLLLGPLIKSDSGWFLCVANHQQERDHRYIYLSVTEGSSQLVPIPLPRDGPVPRFNLEQSGWSTVKMRWGQTASLPCRIVPQSALQFVSIQWTKDGHVLIGSRHKQHTDGTLVIESLTSQDSGVYTCTASTQQQLEQSQLQLRVQTNLRITTAPNNIQVSEGSTAVLPCVVSGDNVSISWSRNGVPVRPNGHSVQMSPDGSLLLNNVKPSDRGSYTCNAYTGIYSVSATAEVRVIKDMQQGPDLLPECVDQPELANCELIVYARLCSNPYYSSFCCASCTRHTQRRKRFGRLD